jgi:hypothetical protein
MSHVNYFDRAPGQDNCRRLVQSLDGDGVALAMRHMQAQRHLTVLDSFAQPAALIEMAKSLHGAERAVRNALEIVL